MYSLSQSEKKAKFTSEKTIKYTNICIMLAWFAIPIVTYPGFFRSWNNVLKMLESCHVLSFFKLTHEALLRRIKQKSGENCCLVNSSHSIYTLLEQRKMAFLYNQKWKEIVFTVYIGKKLQINIFTELFMINANWKNARHGKCTASNCVFPLDTVNKIDHTEEKAMFS